MYVPSILGESRWRSVSKFDDLIKYFPYLFIAQHHLGLLPTLREALLILLLLHLLMFPQVLLTVYQQSVHMSRQALPILLDLLVYATVHSAVEIS